MAAGDGATAGGKVAVVRGTDVAGPVIRKSRELRSTLMGSVQNGKFVSSKTT